MPRQIMFLCTGNYYRSRFAEELFNHLARDAGIDYVADSRGLALEIGCNDGPMSRHSQAALRERGIAIEKPTRFPRQACADDFVNADLVIALKEAEHRAYMNRKFPEWSSRIRYWHIHDLDQATADEAIPQIEELVRKLVEELRITSPIEGG